MKIIKFLLWIVAIAIIPLCTIVVADNCFETVIDSDGKIYYIDPFDNWSVFEDKEALFTIYWDKIKCTGEKKVYTSEEYMNKIYEDLYKEKQKSDSSWSTALIELIISILWCVAMWKIFVKAWKPGIYSIIPIYNFYELTDIAWLQWMFWKAFLCWLFWIVSYLFAPILWIILVLISAFYGAIVNFYVARNFWWSTLASVLYVIFNPIAMIILAFWNDKYYLTEQKDKIKEITMKAQINEIINDASTSKNNYTHTTTWINNEKVFNTWWESNSQNKDPIKYIDPNTI